MRNIFYLSIIKKLSSTYKYCNETIVYNVYLLLLLKWINRARYVCICFEKQPIWTTVVVNREIRMYGSIANSSYEIIAFDAFQYLIRSRWVIWAIRIRNTVRAGLDCFIITTYFKIYFEKHGAKNLTYRCFVVHYTFRNDSGAWPW